jgi:hypothetical protein
VANQYMYVWQGWGKLYVLIETVWQPFGKEIVWKRIRRFQSFEKKRDFLKRVVSAWFSVSIRRRPRQCVSIGLGVSAASFGLATVLVVVFSEKTMHA